MQKRLIIYSPGAYMASGHAFDYVGGLGAALSNKGVVVHVVGLQGPLSLPPIIRQHRVSAHAQGVIRARRGQFGPLGDVAFGLRRLRCGRRLLRKALSLHAELDAPHILFETFEYVTLGRVLRTQGLRNGCSCIFHDTNFSASQYSFVTAVYKFAVRRYVRMILEAVSVAYVHGPHMRANLLRLVGLDGNDAVAGKTQAIPHGAPNPQTVEQIEPQVARSRLGLPRGCRVLLAFGTLRRDKKYDTIVEALAEAPGWLLLFAGPEGGYTYDSLMALAARHAVQDRVRIFPGYVPVEDHPLFFGAADAVAAIYDQRVRHESGTGQKARAFLKPIIVGGGPDLLEYAAAREVGWTVDSSRPQTLSSVLNQISGLGELERSALRERIRECAVERSWDAVADVILSRSLG